MMEGNAQDVLELFANNPELLRTGEQEIDVNSFFKFFERNINEHFPGRLKHHTTFADPTLSFANLSRDEKRRILALQKLVTLFDIAEYYWFEIEEDYEMFKEFFLEEVALINQLSRGDGTGLRVAKSVFKEVSVANQQQQQKGTGGLLRKLRGGGE